MNLRGDYSPDVCYQVGDVVRFGGMAFELRNPAEAGTPPTYDKAWSRLRQELWDVVDLIISASALNVGEDGIILKGTTDPSTSYLISVDDSGLTPDLAVDLIEEGL